MVEQGRALVYRFTQHMVAALAQPLQEQERQHRTVALLGVVAAAVELAVHAVSAHPPRIHPLLEGPVTPYLLAEVEPPEHPRLEPQLAMAPLEEVALLFYTEEKAVELAVLQPAEPAPELEREVTAALAASPAVEVAVEDRP